MRVKAWLTSDTLERVSDPQLDPREDSDFKALAILFPDDPLIAFEELGGWYVAATALDEADEQDAWSLRDTLDALVSAINGTHRIFRSDNHANPVRPTYEYAGKKSGASARIYSAVIFSVSPDGLDAQSASALLKLAAEEKNVRLVLALFGRLERQWFWIDAYRIWEIVQTFWDKRADFNDWLSEQGDDFRRIDADFQNTANDPNLWGERRHAKRNYRPRPRPDGTPTEPITQEEAQTFLKRLVVGWIAAEFQLELRP